MTNTATAQRKQAASPPSKTPEVATSEVATSALEIDHGQRRRVVAAQLLEDIFAGRLRAGERLILRELAGRLGVSSTPIREALVQLEGIGIIRFVPNCGGVVRQMTVQDIRELCQVRRALECEATRSACGRIELGELHELAAAFRKMQAAKRLGPTFVERARNLDSRLHDLIAQSCGNRFLAGELERLKILFRALRDASWRRRVADRDYYRFAEEATEHLAVVEALIAGDARSASRAMSRHIRAGVKYWSGGLPQ